MLELFPRFITWDTHRDLYNIELSTVHPSYPGVFHLTRSANLIILTTENEEDITAKMCTVIRTMYKCKDCNEPRSTSTTVMKRCLKRWFFGGRCVGPERNIVSVPDTDGYCTSCDSRALLVSLGLRIDLRFVDGP